MIPRTLGAFLQRTFSRYLLASVLSLGFDTATFLALLSAGVPSVPALAVGYSVGILAHWIISTRFVFDDGMTKTGAERTRAKGLFVLTALLGLAITLAIGTVAGWIHLDPRIAKLIAIVVSFLATYAARRVLIFRA